MKKTNKAALDGVGRIIFMCLFGLPLAVVLAPIFAVFFVVGYGSHYSGAIRTYFRLKAHGRVAGRELRLRIARDGVGTLIVDSPTLGWPIARVWWTDECLNLLPASVREEPQDIAKIGSDAGEIAVFDSYVSEETGRGLLVATVFRKKALNAVLAKFSRCSSMKTWSGAVVMVRHGLSKTSEADGDD